MRFRNHCVIAILWFVAAAALTTAESQSGKRDVGAELAARVKEFDKWSDPGMSDLKEESEALRRWTAIIPELQKLFRSGAKITVEVPKSITWPRSDASKEIEKISPEEFSKRIGKLAFTAGPQQVAATEPEYSLNGDRATVRMKKFLLDVTGLIQSTVIQYEMTWRQGKTWEIQELRQTVRSPDEAERKEIDAAIAKIKVPDTRIPR